MGFGFILSCKDPSTQGYVYSNGSSSVPSIVFTLKSTSEPVTTRSAFHYPNPTIYTLVEVFVKWQTLFEEMPCNINTNFPW